MKSADHHASMLALASPRECGISVRLRRAASKNLWSIAPQLFKLH
jgi:hypothetical protein